MIEAVADLDQRALNRLSLQLQQGRGTATGKTPGKFSVNRYLNAINVFLGWAEREGVAGHARARTHRLPERVLEVLSREEIERLVDCARTERDAAIVRVLAETGLRAPSCWGPDVRSHPAGAADDGQGPRQGVARAVDPLAPATYRRLRRLGRRLDDPNTSSGP
ncbi:MAG: hypothetical protein ACREQM_21130 [Candidatus Dormibacteraceae bacterium]